MEPGHVSSYASLWSCKLKEWIEIYCFKQKKQEETSSTVKSRLYTIFMPKPEIHQSVQNCIHLMGNVDSGILIPLYDTGINVAATW